MHVHLNSELDDSVDVDQFVLLRSLNMLKIKVPKIKVPTTFIFYHESLWQTKNIPWAKTTCTK